MREEHNQEFKLHVPTYSPVDILKIQCENPPLHELTNLNYMYQRILLLTF